MNDKRMVDNLKRELGETVIQCIEALIVIMAVIMFIGILSRR